MTRTANIDALVRARADIARSRFGLIGPRVGRLRDEQARFSVHRRPDGGRSFVPETGLAAKIARTEAGRRMLGMLTAGLRTVESVTGAAVPLHTLALSDTRIGHAFNTSMSLLRGEIEGDPNWRDLPRWLFTAATAASGMLSPATWMSYASVYDGVLNLGPQTVKSLIALAGTPGTTREAKDAEAAWVLAHEFEHLVTPSNRPRPDSERAQLPGWIEEAAASLLALQTGPAIARALSTETSDAVMGAQLQRSAYAETTRTLASLLQLAGIDARTPQGMAAARVLLQGRPLEAVPATIAALLTRGRPDAATLQPRLAAAITASNGNPSLVRDLRKVLGTPD